MLDIKASFESTSSVIVPSLKDPTKPVDLSACLTFWYSLYAKVKSPLYAPELTAIGIMTAKETASTTPPIMNGFLCLRTNLMGLKDNNFSFTLLVFASVSCHPIAISLIS